jgi:hypothetical protein
MNECLKTEISSTGKLILGFFQFADSLGINTERGQDTRWFIVVYWNQITTAGHLRRTGSPRAPAMNGCTGFEIIEAQVG